MSNGKSNAQQKSKAVKPPNKAKSKAQVPQSDLPLTPHAEPTIAKQSANEHRKPDQTTRWRMLLDSAAVLIGGYALFVYSGQWNAAKEANTLNGDNFRAAQRAWVGSIGFEFVQIKPEQPIIWQTVLKNFGNSPAMNVEIRNTAQLVVSSRVDPTMAWMLTAALPNSTGKTLTMFNGQTYTEQGGRNFLLYRTQVEDINHGKSILVYIAEIRYRDIFGVPHKTMICQVLDALGTHGCGFGDQAD